MRHLIWMVLFIGPYLCDGQSAKPLPLRKSGQPAKAAGSAKPSVSTRKPVVSTSQACPGTPTVEDIDGNVYKTVKIGTQCWMKSNLKVSRYTNGDAIPTDMDNEQWSRTEEGAYAIYEDDPANDALYGKLYNHYAVTDDRGLCPTGWHVPSDEEWTTLEDFLGGSKVAGGKLKSTAKQPTPGGWDFPNRGATNSSGFSAPPGGLRTSNGDCSSMTYLGCWRSSSVSSASYAWSRNLLYNDSDIFRDFYNRPYGFSVRCCRD